MTNIQEDLITFNSRNNPYYNIKAMPTLPHIRALRRQQPVNTGRGSMLSPRLSTRSSTFAAWLGLRLWAESPCDISRAATSTSEEEI